MTHCAVMGGWFGMSFFPKPGSIVKLNRKSLLTQVCSFPAYLSVSPPASGQGLLCLSALGYRRVNCSEPPRCATKPSLFSGGEGSVESPLGGSSLFSVKYHIDRPGLALQTRLKLICLLTDEWGACRESLQNKTLIVNTDVRITPSSICKVQAI